MEFMPAFTEQDLCTTKSHHHGGASRHIPHSELPPEIVEKRNERERLRVTAVNGEFRRLQRLLPTIANRTRRVSKERILRLAVHYIRNLRLMIDDADGATSAAAAARMMSGTGSHDDNRRCPGRSVDFQGQTLEEQYTHWPASSEHLHPQGQSETLEERCHYPQWPSPEFPHSYTTTPPHGACGVPPGGAWSMPALEDAIQGVHQTPPPSLTTSPASLPVTPSSTPLPSPPGSHPLTPSPVALTHRSPLENDACSAPYGFHQNHFRFRRDTPDDDDVTWDASITVVPPAGLEENLVYNTCFIASYQTTGTHGPSQKSWRRNPLNRIKPY